MAWFSGPGSPRRSHSSGKSYHYSTSSSRSSRARPRSGYINTLLYQIKYYLRQLYDYARRHPAKMFMLVVMPLITGGALADVLRRFGVRLPAGLAGMMPGGSERGRSYGGGSDLGGGGGVQSLMRLAQMFM